MYFTISSHTGDTVKIHAPNWLQAMARACDFFEVEIQTIGEWHCVRAGDGAVAIKDIYDDRSWVVRRDPDEIKVRAVGPQWKPKPEPARKPDVDDFDIHSTPPALIMPKSSLRKEMRVFSEDDLNDRLFELSCDITAADPHEACKIALRHVLALVDCDGANVIRGAVSDQKMVFLLGHGSLGIPLLHRSVPFDTGIIGMCHGSSMVLHVNTMTQDRLAHLPEELHPQIRNVLAVPIVNDDGWIFGVIQLLNLSDEAEQQHIDAVAAIARTLATTLALKLA